MKHKRWLIYQLLRNANLRKGPTGEVKGKTSSAMRQHSTAKLIRHNKEKNPPRTMQNEKSPSTPHNKKDAENSTSFIILNSATNLSAHNLL